MIIFIPSLVIQVAFCLAMDDGIAIEKMNASNKYIVNILYILSTNDQITYCAINCILEGAI